MPRVEVPRSHGLLKIFFLLHIMLSSWGVFSSEPFTAPVSYVYYNVIYMGAIMTAIMSRHFELEPVLMAIFVNIYVIILECITMFLYWPWESLDSRGRVYFVFSLLNLILRPFTCAVLIALFIARYENGRFSESFTRLFRGPHRRNVRNYMAI
ncbi:unnamed protein product [Allacma fusca]|uniref:Uncharacterized protein n=1 Tax=Allacma fusca TaxID=39272 RepID=A0A8J2PK71_9HEXA|nr:unnamed protein product [Allacma fusca]